MIILQCVWYLETISTKVTLFFFCCFWLLFFFPLNVFPSGLTLEFADQSGMNAFGHIMLGTMDVHHQWTKVGANLLLYM